jgi:hypothetical protein
LRNKFAGYHRPTKDEFDALWKQSTIVLDTNALLNLYRYSVDARNDFLNALQAVSSRLWMPHQVAMEFYENRLERIREQREIGKNLSTALDSLAKQAATELQKRSKNPFLDTSELKNKVERFVEDLKDEISQQHREGMERYGITFQDDPILEILGSMYHEQAGNPYTQSEMKELAGVADERYANSVPPGYKDIKNKRGDKAYGDFIIWRQIIDHARTSSSDIIFITDDNKEDWWWRFEGQTLGPRPELRDEFHSETGHMFYAYSPEQFLSNLQSRDIVRISSDVVNEVRTTSAHIAQEQHEYIQPKEAWYKKAARSSDLDSLDTARQLLRRSVLRADSTAEELFELEHRRRQFDADFGRTLDELDYVQSHIDRHGQLSTKHDSLVKKFDHLNQARELHIAEMRALDEILRETRMRDQALRQEIENKKYEIAQIEARTNMFRLDRSDGSEAT